MKPALIENSQSAWLTGEVGASRTAWLAENLYDKYQSDARNFKGSTFLSYSPWMSFVEEREALHSYFAPPASQVSVDKGLLRELRRLFWTRPRCPLGRTSVTFPWISIDTQAGSRNLDLYFEAVELVSSSGEAWRRRVNVLAKTIVPLKTLSPRARPGGVGFSTQLIKGAVFLSRPNLGKLSAIELAINLAHEIGHQSLNIYLASDRVIAGKIDAPVYSAIRKTKRPAILSFHAMVALALIVDFSRARLASPGGGLSDIEHDYLAGQLKIFEASLKIAIKSFGPIQLTQLGQELLAEFQNLSVKG